MASTSNEDVVRQVYDAFGAGDTEKLAELFAPDIVWSVPGNSRIAGEHKGHEGVFGLFGLCGELSGGTLRVEPESITARGDNAVVSTHRVTAQKGDEALDVIETEQITLQDGKLIRVDESVSDQTAADKFWS